MAQIIQFVPKHAVDAIKNVDAFIEMAKNELTVFGADLNWDSDIWDVTSHVEYRANKATNICWGNIDKKSRWDTLVLLEQPLLDFAKAYIRYEQGLKKTKTYRATVDSFKALERAIVNVHSIACPTSVDVNILNIAQQILKDTFCHNHAAVCAQNLEKITKFLADNLMLKVPAFEWKSSLKQTDSGRISGIDYTDYRSDKLPTDQCLYAIADIYNNTELSKDKLCAALAVILLSNPCRIGEVLTLPVDCIVENYQGYTDSIGIRWFPEKGGEPFIKPVLPIWRDLVIESISTIKQLTEDSRTMAKWYENNTESIYLPHEYSYLGKQEYVDTLTIRKLFGFSKKTLSSFIKKHNIEQKFVFQKPALIKMRDLNSILRVLLPDGFPYLYKENKLKYSEALFVVPYNFFRELDKQSFSTTLFQKIKYQHISSAFGGIKGNPSMFDRHSHTEPDGEHIIFRTHSARHMQDTIAEYAQIPQKLRAYFAGRKDIRHNQYYSHTPKDILADKSFEIANQGDITPNNAESATEVFSQSQVIASLLRDNLEDAVHITQLGYCIIGTGNTCKKYMDHFLCSDHLYVKGDKRLNTLEEYIEFTRNIISKRSQLSANIKHDKQILAVLLSIQAVLDNPKIPKGSFFKLMPGKDYSRMRIAYFRKKNKLLGNAQQGTIPLIKVGELCLDI